MRQRSGCGGHAESKISHSPLQSDFKQIRKVKKTTLKFYVVLKKAEGGGGGEEVGRSVKEEGALQVKMIKRHRHTKRERESYSVIG